VAGVDAVGVGDHAALLGLAEHLGQAHPREHGGSPAGLEQVAQDLARADARELVHVADQQQVGAGRDRLDELVGQQQVEHGGLVDHHQVGLQRPVLVEGGLAARAQLEQPVQGLGVHPGQLRQALGGPAGGRGQDHPGLLGLGQGDHGPDGEALAAARGRR
jgi:hypothetical protein